MMSNVNLTRFTLRQFIVLQFLILFSFPVLAYDFTYNNLKFNIISKENCEVEITEVSTYSTVIYIPSTVEYNGKNYQVTAIADKAFYDCSSLSRVEIPNSITRIGEFAFGKCSSLRSVNIPNSVTSIGSGAFGGCSGLEKAEFESIESLCNIDFANAYSNPLYYAHNLYINGEKITDLIIPNSVTSIGNYAFSGCSGLTSITIPNSVTVIRYAAFNGCSGLTSITIPNSVYIIGDYAFSGCSGLERAEFESVESLCSIYFYNKASNPLSYAHNLYINGEKITDLIIPNSVRTIWQHTFSGCSGLTSLTIPNSVTGIGYAAFYGCSGLTSITIPNSVTSIGDYAFYGCSGLTSITIPNSVTSIGDYAFQECNGLTSINMANSVTSIGSYAFEGCTSLEKAEFESIESICNISFKNSTSNPLFYAHNLYIDGEKITDLIIPNSVTTIEMYAFANCSSLISVKIPYSVTTIKGGAFRDCSNLAMADIDINGEIWGGAFRNCNNLTVLILGRFVTWIATSAFENTGIKHAFLSEINAMNDDSFFEIFGNDVTFHFYNKTEGLDIVNEDNCLYSRNHEILYCGLALSGDYIIPETVKTIESGAFYACDKLKSVLIPLTVSSVGKDVFGGQSGVGKYAKPSTLNVPTSGNAFAINYDVYDSRIEDGFVYTRNKRTVYFAPTQLPDDYVLPETIKTIGDCAFAYSDFKSISLGNSLTTIGNSAFSNCSGLKSLRLGASVSQIGKGAWNDCKSIEMIECSMPTPIAAPNDIFPLNVYDNATLYVPEGSMDKYMEVAPWSYFYNIVEGKAVGGV